MQKGSEELKFENYTTPRRNSSVLLNNIKSINSNDNDLLSIANSGKEEYDHCFKSEEKSLKTNNKIFDDKEKSLKLRRRVCLLLAKNIEKYYNLEKLKAREITLKIEMRIRNLYLESKDDYKKKILFILKLIRV